MTSTCRARKVKNYRARKRAGLAVMRVPLPEYDLLQMLIEQGWLTVAEALERRLVERAVAEFVVDSINRWHEEKKV